MTKNRSLLIAIIVLGLTTLVATYGSKWGSEMAAAGHWLNQAR